MDQLIAVLAERLSACVPAGLRVEAREGMLIYSDATCSREVRPFREYVG